VQGALEDVLNQRLCGSTQQRTIKVVAASRTDTGVHARGQAIHFDVPVQIDDIAAVEYSINQMLTPDLRLWNLQLAPEPVMKQIPGDWPIKALKEGDGEMSGDCEELVEATYLWNVLYDSTKKLYSYRLSLGPVMDPLQRYSRWHPGQAHKIDTDQLRRILRSYEGTHDFRAFAGAVEQAEKKAGRPLSTVRTVYSADLVDEGKGNYRIDFMLKGALYKQVRNMVGSALDVCFGKLSEEAFLGLLKQDSATRVDNRSKPAPAQGLTLEHVCFDASDF
jgi:tRNA pseudouridine38-40 synthase